MKFVYMTGHLDGYGLTGNLHIRNEQIRAYCAANKKILYDFADIESYNPDGVYFGDKDANDNCDYDVERGRLLRRELGDRMAERPSGGMVRLHRGSYAAAQRQSQGVRRMVALGEARRLGRPELTARARRQNVLTERRPIRYPVELIPSGGRQGAITREVTDMMHCVSAARSGLADRQ